MISKYYDKILLVTALVVLLVVFGLAAFRAEPQPAASYIEIPAIRPENTFTVSEMPELALDIEPWEDAPPQSAGPEWVFDVFTPPVILFDTETGEFVLPGTPGEPPRDFGIALDAVQEDLYRVQLTSYIGREGDYLVTLENIETGEQILAREGREYANFGIQVRSIRMVRERIDHTGETAVTSDVLYVDILDERLDQNVTLQSDRKKIDAEPTAIFRAADDPEQKYRAREGESFRHDGRLYRVEALTPPSAAIVTRSGGEEGDEPETRTLRVTRPAAPAPAGGQPPQQPTGLDRNRM